jgi:hypothetical protein
MDLRVHFQHWLDEEIGSAAAPALRQHLIDRDYRLFSMIEHQGRWQWDVYHPLRGFFRGVGADDAEALQGVLRQIWLVEAFQGAPGPEIGTTPEP